MKMAPHLFSEFGLIERNAVELLAELGWETADCYQERFGLHGTLGRETPSDVVLKEKLRTALKQLNPGQSEAIDLAVEELTRDRVAVSPAQANRGVYELLKDGVKVKIRSSDDREEIIETVRVIDWDNPSRNNFFLASQFWVTGDMYKRRPDLVGFVNGIPLIFFELKASHKRLENAYRHNLQDYKDTIPQIFWYNAFIILSNGSKSRIGTITSEWEHFSEWKKINNEGEEGVVSLETIIRGTCDPKKLLDLVENFIVYKEGHEGVAKLVAKNHQYLGVNKAIERVQDIRENQGRLGVFWHTQGSGKSYSMAFFAQKVLRQLPGNWTFVIVTDRQELDDQIYGTFVNCGAVTEEHTQADSSEKLRQLLREDHRYVFTLIQKFRTERGERHPLLSDRSDVIVITDEAHRTQYDVFAQNMRDALPHAAFIGFTGTPLMIGEEKTRDVFGDYVSIYNFKQSIDDNATVPLYYENRMPGVQLALTDVNEKMWEIIDEAELNEKEERKLTREFKRQHHIITDNDRLELIAKDIVTHFLGRGYRGKAMVLSIDKVTAVRMYDKVQKHWKQHLEQLNKELSIVDPSNELEYEQLTEKIRFVEETDMAVVVSQSQNEIQDFKKAGLEIAPHRRRMVKEDLETKFKNPEDPFRIVFVCAMWITGFDAPSCSTIYLDKPMRNHTLMQAIARANRVFKEKVNGLIVDYVGVFQDLEKALAIYGFGIGGGGTSVQPKSALVEQLRNAIADVSVFCAQEGIDLDQIEAAKDFMLLRLLDDAVDALLVNDDIKRRYLSLASRVNRLYKAVLPDPKAHEFAKARALFVIIAEKIRSLSRPPDISDVLDHVRELLEESIDVSGVELQEWIQPTQIDLSKLDIKALKARFAAGPHKRTRAEQLRHALESKIEKMVEVNRSRVDYQEQLERMVEEYNKSTDVETLIKQLFSLTEELEKEDARAVAEGFTEEGLAIFDLLARSEASLSETERQQVKKVTRVLLQRVKDKLVIDWRKKQQSRAAVKLSIEECLDHLPRETDDRKMACQAIYQHIYDSYFGEGKSIYASAGV
jgi:type I restriction enzyme R subunit